MKFPLRLAHDAQGPSAIFDADGKCVALFTDSYKAANGFCYTPSKHPTPDADAFNGTTYWPERNATVRAVFDLLSRKLPPTASDELRRMSNAREHECYLKEQAEKALAMDRRHITNLSEANDEYREIVAKLRSEIADLKAAQMA